MRAPSAFGVDHASRRIVSALAGFGVALTMIRYAFAAGPRRDEQPRAADTV
ncbi:hypothetical protein [uncultured Jatrophihabitans sp.]|uniref:hypothetical protein n=1 Tax=uncultured Jatrophihabitans sp. TaxID=1610747 RepID=UPI0035C97EC4